MEDKPNSQITLPCICGSEFLSFFNLSTEEDLYEMGSCDTVDYLTSSIHVQGIKTLKQKLRVIWDILRYGKYELGEIELDRDNINNLRDFLNDMTDYWDASYTQNQRKLYTLLKVDDDLLFDEYFRIRDFLNTQLDLESSKRKILPHYIYSGYLFSFSYTSIMHQFDILYQIHLEYSNEKDTAVEFSKHFFNAFRYKSKDGGIIISLEKKLGYYFSYDFILQKE